ncbi:MAG: leucine-rich repeat protein [Prevotella sp.]|nr:leucine-rich repeat protein [Prevotella sp.]
MFKIFSGCSGLTSVTIPSSVTSIGRDAFSGCSGLTSVSIGRGVKSIGDRAFNACSGLTSIKVESGNTKYDSRDNCNAIIETASNTLIVGCQNTTISDGVKSIGNMAFASCSGLTSIIIPSSVTSIGYNAFSWCSGLLKVYCHAEKVPDTQGNVFFDSNINNATLHVPTGSVEAYKAAEPWNEFKEIVAIPEPVNGDVDGDGVVDANDLVSLVNMIAAGNVSAAGDLNGDGMVDVADVIVLVDIITGQ